MNQQEIDYIVTVLKDVVINLDDTRDIPKAESLVMELIKFVETNVINHLIRDLSKFKIGQLWKTRSGNIVTIQDIEISDPDYPILANNEWYRWDGQFYSDMEHDKDLIELVWS